MRRTVAAVVVLLAGSVAHADDQPFHIGSLPAWYFLGGLTTGGTVALAEKGLFVGGELSVARLSNGNFVGAYTDAYYDWGADGTYVTAGLEAGHKYLSLDGGVAIRFADDEIQHGWTGRLSVGLGAFSLFGRYAYLTDTMRDDHVIQVGLLLKLPLVTSGGKF